MIQREKEGEKTTKTENEGLIHRDITEKKKENNQDTLNKEIEESPNDIPQVVMEECENYELDYKGGNI